MAWYSTADQLRLDNYETLQSFYKNKVSDTLKRLSDVDARIYLAVNICKTIANVTPDFLFGEPPRITGANQELINTIIKTTKFNSKMYKASLTSTVKGDAVLKLYVKDSKVMMQVIQPDNFFPTYDAYGELESCIIATIIEENSKKYILKECISKDNVTRRLFELDDKNEESKEWPLTMLLVTSSLMPEEQNPIKEIPVVHIPNFVGLGDSNFGISDFEGEKDMILALNKRLSEIDYIISKHADPKIQVPQGILGRPNVDIIEMAGTTKMVSTDVNNKDLKIIEVKNGDVEVKYIQPDLSGLEQAFEEIDRILNYILMDTETSPSLLTVNKDGNMAESGKALRFRLMNTIRKIRRKQTYYTEGIKAIFDIAQKLLDVDAEEVDVEFIDTITSDTDEIIDRAVKLFEKGLISHEEALKIAFPNTTTTEIEKMILDVIDEKIRNQKMFSISKSSEVVVKEDDDGTKTE